MKNLSKLLLAISLIGLVFVSACKKEKEDINNNQDNSDIGDCRIANTYLEGNFLLSTREYLSDGRISKEIFTDSPMYNAHSIIYTYTDSTIEEKKIAESNLHEVYIYLYKIDKEKGIALSSIKSYMDKDTAFVIDTTYYSYDANLFLVKKENKGMLNTYVIMDGNVQSATMLLKHQDTTIINSYEYYNDKLAPKSFVESISNTFLGKSNKNLVKKITSGFVSNVFYEFDAVGNITKFRLDEKEQYSYSYSCK